jgi:abortive infection bacteriophage resistance protein
LRNRKMKGELWTLFKGFTDDELKFYQYFRMSRYQFSNLLKTIHADLLKKNTTFREAVSPQEKLGACLT